jgi:hypothetical protein
MSILFRLSVTRALLWWIADRGILRVSIEEAFKRNFLRGQKDEAHVVRLPAAVPEDRDQRERASFGR